MKFNCYFFMRLWSIHPKYLDSRGLTALWREALLAKAVLKGETKGYKHHPQLVRFRDSNSPLKSIAFYLQVVYDEAVKRGYNFDTSKFDHVHNVELIRVTRGQLNYEWRHLKGKLKKRNPELYARFRSFNPDPHPLFYVIPGTAAEWEKKSVTR